MLGQFFNPLLCHEDPAFTLGTVGFDDDGNGWVFFQAAATIRPYHACRLPSEDHRAAEVTLTNANYGERIVVPQVALPDEFFGWGLIYGHGQLAVVASVAAHAELRTSATSGRLDDASATNSEPVAGLTLTTAQGGLSGQKPAQFNWPIVSS